MAKKRIFNPAELVGKTIEYAEITANRVLVVCGDVYLDANVSSYEDVDIYFEEALDYVVSMPEQMRLGLEDFD